VIRRTLYGAATAFDAFGCLLQAQPNVPLKLHPVEEPHPDLWSWLANNTERVAPAPLDGKPDPLEDVSWTAMVGNSLEVEVPITRQATHRDGSSVGGGGSVSESSYAGSRAGSRAGGSRAGSRAGGSRSGMWGKASRGKLGKPGKRGPSSGGMGRALMGRNISSGSAASRGSRMSGSSRGSSVDTSKNWENLKPMDTPDWDHLIGQVIDSEVLPDEVEAVEGGDLEGGDTHGPVEVGAEADPASGSGVGEEEEGGAAEGLTVDVARGGEAAPWLPESPTSRD